jgi:hypothetical protein
MLGNPAVAQAAVTEIDHGHQIEFGESILVWSVIETDSPVTEAMLIYRPEGAGRISTYDYATVTRDGGHTRVEALIPTAGGSYLPPGTRLSVRFELDLADGSSATVGPFPIMYLDPDRPWASITAAGVPVELFFYGVSESAARSLLDEAGARLPSVAQALGVDYGALPRWVAVIYPSIDAFTDTFPPTSQAASDNRFFGGFAMGEYHLLVQASPSPSRFVHELTHLVIEHATSAPLAAPVPSWLHEGLAEHFETGSSESADRIIRRTDPSNLQRFAAMNTMPGRSEDIAVFYPQSASFVGYLLSRHGTEDMAATLMAINSGQRISDALVSAYSIPMPELENGWRESLGLPAVATPPSASPSPAGATPASTPTALSTTVAQPTTTAISEGSDAGSQSVLVVSLLVGSAMLLVTMWLISKRLRSPHR